MSFSGFKRCIFWPQNALFVMVLFALSGVFLACGEESESPEQSTDISVAEASVDATDILVGQTVTVSARMTNVSDTGGEFTAILEIDGSQQDSRDVFVEPEDQQQTDDSDNGYVEFDWTPEEAGTFEVTVSGVEAGTVEVTERSANVAVVAAQFPPEQETSIRVGEAVIVWADVQNNGTADGELLLELEADGDVVDSQTVGVQAPGPNMEPEDTEYRSELFWLPEQSGDYEISVNGIVAGSLEVGAVPEVTIVEPVDDGSEPRHVEGPQYGGDSWYREVEFEGFADDAVDGELTGDSLQWTTTVDKNNDGNLETRHLGEGTSFTAKLYMEDDQCGALVEHLIELEATNSSGQSQTALGHVTLQMVIC